MYRIRSIVLVGLCVLATFCWGQEDILSPFQKDSIDLFELRYRTFEVIYEAPDSADYYLEQMKEGAIRLEMPEILCKYYDYSRMHHRLQGDLEKCLAFSLKAREDAMEIEDKNYLTACIFNLAVNTESAGLKERSLSAYLECVDHFHDGNDMKGLEVTFNNIAGSYIDMGEFKKAKRWIDSLEVLQAKYDFNTFEISTLQALYFREKGDCPSALEMINKSLASDKMKEAQFGSITDRLYIKAEILLEMGDRDEAWACWEKANSLQDIDDDVDLKMVQLSTLAEFRRNDCDWEGVYACLSELKNMTDSLDSQIDYLAIDRGLNLMEQSSKNEILKGKEAIMSRMMVMENLHKKKFIYTATPLLILVLGFSIMYLLIRRKNRRLNEATEEVVLQDKKINDSIAYGNRIQQAIFADNASYIDNPYVEVWHKANGSRSQTRSWSHALAEGILICFYHPTTDVVSSAFNAILTHSSFKDLMGVMLGAKSADVDLRKIYNAIGNGVLERAATEEDLDSPLSLVYYDKLSGVVITYDGSGEVEEIHTRGTPDTIDLNDLKLAVDSGDVLVYSQDVESLLRERGASLLSEVSNASSISERLNDLSNQGDEVEVEGDYLCVKLNGAKK